MAGFSQSIHRHLSYPVSMNSRQIAVNGAHCGVSRRDPALLALSDGSVFHGECIGAPGRTVGEVVFNTAMTGYQEILTDPSYCQQIVTLTYPHVGNTGINPEDEESRRPFAAGLVIRELPVRQSNWRAAQSLPDYLAGSGIVAIGGVDTRRLTRLLRDKGALGGCIEAGDVDPDRAVAAARAFPGLGGMDLARVVSTPTPYEWFEGSWRLGRGFVTPTSATRHVVAFDYGVKRNILRMLADRGCRITVLPAQATAEDALALRPDGVCLTNGPGDPGACDYAIRTIRTLLDETRIPVFGICLGHQLMALASGARTLKMKFGHHGANHPVRDLRSGAVVITSQNHGFAVDPASLPANLEPTHVSLFDGSLQGLARVDRPAFCFQGHPEASPGPRDIGYLFDRFIELMD